MHGIGLILEEFSDAAVDYSHPAEEDFGSYSADPSEAELQQSFIEKTWTQITATLSSILDEDRLSDDEETGSQEEDERSEYRVKDISIEPGNGMFIANSNSKSRTVDLVPSEWNSGMKSDGSMATPQDNEWFPWPNIGELPIICGRSTHN